MGFCLNPLSIFPVLPSLGHLTNIDFRIEIRCKWLSVVACIAVNNIKGVNLIKMMFGCIGGENSCDSWIKATTQYGCEPCILEPVMVRPLPFIFKFGDLSWLIICCIQVIHSRLEASLHDG